jgi:hypothetical protein
MTEKINIQPRSVILLGVILLALLCFNFKSSELQIYPSLQVVVNKDVGVSELTISEFEKIIHGEQFRWPNEKKSIFLAFIEPTQPIGIEICSEMFNMTTREFNRFWTKLMFEGKLLNSPEHFYYEEEVINFVSRTPGAIGIISSGTKSDLVKTVTITND